MKHARLSPSASKRWLNCAGSPRLIEALPASERDIKTEYANEGTRAHAMAEGMLKGHAMEIKPGDEMYDAAALFFTTVMEEKALGGDLHVESTVTLGLLGTAEDIFGTADATVVSAARRKITVADLKYGQGVLVEVRDNPQLMIYLLGATFREYSRRVLANEDLPGFTYDDVVKDALGLFDEYEAVIVQPRASHADGPVRRWTYSAEELYDFAVKVLKPAVQAAQQPDAPLVAGEWCRFCPARAHCPAAASHAALVAQTDFELVPVPAPPSPETLPIEVCADLLNKVGVLEGWVAALKARVLRELEAGREVPGWKLVEKRAVRQWADPAEVRAWAVVSGLTDDELLEPRALRSPAQLEKIVGKKFLPKELTVQVSGGATLAPSSDARPAIAAGPQSDFKALPRGSTDADIHGVSEEILREH